MARTRGLSKDSLVQFFLSKGWKLDQWNHLTKVVNDGLMRVKVQATSVRVEKQIKVCDRNEWMKIRGAYLKDLSIVDDKLRGLNR